VSTYRADDDYDGEQKQIKRDSNNPREKDEVVLCKRSAFGACRFWVSRLIG